ncbi:hypothetical protein INR49_009022 [Caranx melampygus]|nr:hypothetical protein INR49_009022 [Caranx melampygus]
MTVCGTRRPAGRTSSLCPSPSLPPRRSCEHQPGSSRGNRERSAGRSSDRRTDCSDSSGSSQVIVPAAGAPRCAAEEGEGAGGGGGLRFFPACFTPREAEEFRLCPPPPHPQECHLVESQAPPTSCAPPPPPTWFAQAIGHSWVLPWQLGQCPQ